MRALARPFDYERPLRSSQIDVSLPMRERPSESAHFDTRSGLLPRNVGEAPRVSPDETRLSSLASPLLGARFGADSRDARGGGCVSPDEGPLERALPSPCSFSFSFSFSSPTQGRVSPDKTSRENIFGARAMAAEGRVSPDEGSRFLGARGPSLTGANGKRSGGPASRGGLHA